MRVARTLAAPFLRATERTTFRTLVRHAEPTSRIAFLNCSVTCTLGPTHRGERVWLGDHQGLLAAADVVGLPKKDAIAVLSYAGNESDASVDDYVDELEAGLARASQLGAQAVPLLAVGDPQHPVLLSGAVSAVEIVAALQKASAR